MNGKILLLVVLSLASCTERVKRSKRKHKITEYKAFDYKTAKKAIAKTHDLKGELVDTCYEALKGYLDGTNTNILNFWNLAKNECKGNPIGAVALFLVGGIDPEQDYIKEANYQKLSKLSKQFYLPLNEVSYHSYIHGADLAFKVAQYMESKNDAKGVTLQQFFKFDKLEYLSMILGGLAHDWGHPGTGNDVERVIGSFITKLYNGILENFSCDLALLVFLGKQNIEKLDPEVYLFNKEILTVDHSTYPFTPGMEGSFDDVAKNRANYAIQQLNDDNMVGVFTELSDSDREKAATIMRYSIYMTNMNPFDKRTKHAFDKLTQAQVDDLNKEKAFNYQKFKELGGNILLEYKEYYESGAPKLTTDAGEKDVMADFPIKKKEAKVPGMANLNTVSEDLKEKGFIAGMLTHVSDIGNAYQGVEGYKPWFRYLMYEWGQLDCGKYDAFYGIDQAYFQGNIVFPTVKEISKIAPGFYFDKIVNPDSEFSTIKPLVSADKNNKLSDDFTAVKDALTTLFSGGNCGVNLAGLDDFISIESTEESKVDSKGENDDDNNEKQRKLRKRSLKRKHSMRKYRRNHKRRQMKA